VVVAIGRVLLQNFAVNHNVKVVVAQSLGYQFLHKRLLQICPVAQTLQNFQKFGEIRWVTNPTPTPTRPAG
jgi:hypothetical protein